MFYTPSFVTRSIVAQTLGGHRALLDLDKRILEHNLYGVDLNEEAEHAVSDLVNAAYGLTPDAIDLLWATAPPRMPITRREAAGR